jgi:coiled-coil domain-containing protein 130
MAERKAQNKYYPPDWDPSKGSINHYVKSKAKKSSGPVGHITKEHPDRDGKTVRFELPFNIWCGVLEEDGSSSGCGKHIAMGVRYNAAKREAGAYHSTKIWEFNFKCHLCMCL